MNDALLWRGRGVADRSGQHQVLTAHSKCAPGHKALTDTGGSATQTPSTEGKASGGFLWNLHSHWPLRALVPPELQGGDRAWGWAQVCLWGILAHSPHLPKLRAPAGHVYLTPQDGLTLPKAHAVANQEVAPGPPAVTTLRAAVFRCSASSRLTSSLARATSCGSMDSSPSVGASSFSGSWRPLCARRWVLSRSQLQPWHMGGAYEQKPGHSCHSPVRKPSRAGGVTAHTRVHSPACSASSLSSAHGPG